VVAVIADLVVGFVETADLDGLELEESLRRSGHG
jgi:hypothetical protein